MTIWKLERALRAYFEWHHGGVLSVREIPPEFYPLCHSFHPLRGSVPLPEGLSFRTWEQILWISCLKHKIISWIGEDNWEFLRLYFIPVPLFAKMERFEALGFVPKTFSGRSMKKRRLLEKILKNFLKS